MEAAMRSVEIAVLIVISLALILFPYVAVKTSDHLCPTGFYATGSAIESVVRIWVCR